MIFRLSNNFRIAGGKIATRCKNKGRDLLEAYFTNAENPEVNLNGNEVEVVISPMTDLLATYSIESKCIYFGIVRVNAGQRYSNRRPRYEDVKFGNKGRVPSHKHRFINNFYTWYSPDNIGTVSLINIGEYCKVTKEELTSGYIYRDVSSLYNLGYDIWGENKDDWEAEFFIGLYYIDDENVPFMFNMGQCKIICPLHK